MAIDQKPTAPWTFDPAAWLAEYEAVGGGAHVIHMWHSETRDGPATYEGVWLGITYARDEAGEGYRLVEELNAGNASGEEGRRRNLALRDYLIKNRGVVGAAQA